MILNDRWNGADDPFEGGRELVLRHLPAGARVRRARARVVPISIGQASQASFVETLRFPDSGAPGAGSGDRGLTRATVGNAVEIDFHARRTLAGIEGSGLDDVILSVDLGGGYVLVGASGAVVGPGQPVFPLAGDSPPLPGLAVTRFRLDAAGGGSAPQVAAVRVKSVPSNLTLALPGRPALWFHAGELAQPETTPDFAAVLQVFLDGKATVENGFYVLPILLQSDSIARLQVELEIEYLLQASVLPDGLGEATLPFALDGLPQAGAAALAVDLPADARVVPGDPGSPASPASRAKGSFAGTRVALGPTADVTPAAGTVDVAAGSSPAQPLAGLVPAGGLEIVAVDLRLAATTRTAKLQLDLREDDDGKPGAASLLPAPVTFSLDRAAGGLTPWTSVALPAPFQFQAAREQTGWLILQALDGEAQWSVSAAAPGAQGVRGLEQTTDGGFSWRQAALAPPGPAALAGLFRLRSRPATFTMPIELAVGSGAAAQTVSLARFTPQGRVDLSLDLPEVAQGFNQALAPAAAAACPVGELLADGDFASWTRTGSQLGSPHRLSLSPSSETGFQASRIAAGPDGRQAFVVSSIHSQQSLLFQALDLDSETVAWQATGAGSAPVGLAVRSDGSRAYAALAGGAVWILDLAERRSLGVPLPLFAATQALAALALSPDGSRLYLAVEAPGTASAEVVGEGSVMAYDTAQLEAAAAAGGPPPSSVSLATPFPWHAVGLVAAPDGSRVYALVQGTGTHVGQADLLAFEPDSLAFDATLPPLFPASAPAPRALALTPDGAMAVVVADAQVSLVRLQDRAVLASVGGPAAATAVAVEPDGVRAFVAGADGVTAFDVTRRALVLPGVPTGATAGLAVTPQGDRILAAVPGAAVVEAIPIGLPIPAEWALTAGQVRPGTLPPGTPIALLGEAATLTAAAAAAAAAAGPSAISQVVPVMTGCTYELRFQGLATVADAVAELLWRGADGAVVRTDPVPIAMAGKLALHRASFAAPAGATAVEVRFTAPAGAADLAQVSLRADGGALEDLAGGASAWERNPPSPTAGFALTETAEGTRLRNVSPSEVTLSQTVPASAGAAYAFELQGQAVAVPGAPASAPSPRVEIHWQTAKAIEVAPATVLAVLPGSFDAQAAAGTVPPRAEQAEVRLVVPSGAALAVRAVDLRFPAAVRLPVTFVAQAPGELALLDWRVTYDRVPAPPLPIPAGGLPAPTPPPQPARGGCGATRMDLGGPAAAALQPALASHALARNLTEVSGIGPARARQLQAIGIGSLAELATASPTALERALPGVSVAGAGRFVLQARELLRS
jgi:DNA-binding beta-propeller fold protein YncE